MGGQQLLPMTEQTQLAEITVSYKPAIGHKPVVKSALDAYIALKEFFTKDTLSLQEQASVLYLNSSGRVLGGYRLSTGGLTNTFVDIRLILSVALKVAAVSFIIAHNHPTGNLTPSKSDKDFTQRLKEAAKLLELELKDHIIITSGDEYFSFVNEGLM